MDKIPPLWFLNLVDLIRAIGEQLRTARLARGWTQEELAERSGIALSP